MEMYKEIFKKFSVPTLIIDREYKIIDMSESALQMFKSHGIELKSTKCFEVSHASKDPCCESEPDICSARKTFESGEESRATHKHKIEPNEIVHDVIATPIFGKEGEVLYIVEEYHSSVQEFRGLITICPYCKRIKMENGTWKAVDEYIQSHTTAELSHGYCKDCAKQVKGRLK